MKYNVGDKVRIKSIDWYNENKDSRGYIDAAFFDEQRARLCGSIQTIANEGCILGSGVTIYAIEGAYEFIGEESIEGLVEGGTKFGTASNPIEIKSNATKIVLEKKTDKYMNENNTKVDMGEVSDGYHTFNELYEYRMLYNAALFNEFAKQGLYDVHKSRKHSNGEYPFGDSNWFIVMAELPTGQISNHYEMKDWDKFQIPEKPLANKWDEHSPKDVAERLTSFTTPKKEYPKTYEECCKVLGIPIHGGIALVGYWCMEDGYIVQHLETLRALSKLRICRDAYRKIAGEEMGLGKPWEPDYDSGVDKFGIICLDGVVQESNPTTNWERHLNKILDFPTREMRDAFFENFKEEIEQCKELL